MARKKRTTTAAPAATDGPVEPLQHKGSVAEPAPSTVCDSAEMSTSMSPVEAVVPRSAKKGKKKQKEEPVVEVPEPVELSKSQLQRKKKLQRKAEGGKGRMPIVNVADADLPPLPSCPTQVALTELIRKTEGKVEGAKKDGEISALIRSIDSDLNKIKEALPSKPKDKRASTLSLRRQIYDLRQCTDSEEATAMLADVWEQLSPVAAYEAFKTGSHRLGEIKAQLLGRVKDAAVQKRKEKEGAVEARKGVRLQKLTGQEVKELRERDLPMVSTGLEDGVQARLLALLFPTGTLQGISNRLEKVLSVLLEPVMGEANMVRGVKITAASDEELSAAVKKLKSLDVSRSAKVDIPSEVQGARRRVVEAARKVENSGEVFVTLSNEAAVVQGPTAALVNEATELLKAAVEPPQREKPAAAKAELTMEAELARCVMGEGGMGIRKIEAQTGCSIQVKFVKSIANVNIRGSSQDNVDTAKSTMEASASEITRVQVPVESADQMKKILSNNGAMAPRFASLKREYRGGCRFVRDDDAGFTVLSNLPGEAAAAAKELRALVEEAGLQVTTVAVPADEIHVWMRGSNLELLKARTSLVKVAFNRGGGGTTEASGPRLELMGTDEAVSKAEGEIRRVVLIAGVNDTFGLFEACGEDVGLAEDMIGLLMSTRAAKLNEVAKDSGTTLTMLGGGGKGGGRPQPAKNREIRISGAQSDVDLAKKILIRLIKEHRVLRSNTETVTVEVADEAVKLVIGGKGRTIQRIKSSTGVTSIDFEKTDSGNSICSIAGTSGAIARAAALVKAIANGEEADFSKRPAQPKAPVAKIEKVEEPEPVYSVPKLRKRPEDSKWVKKGTPSKRGQSKKAFNLHLDSENEHDFPSLASAVVFSDPVEAMETEMEGPEAGA